MPDLNRKLFVCIDDIDHHDEGCECGDCDSNGKSYGTGIFDVDTPDDCVERVYACNEDASRQRAQARAAEIGVLVD